MQAHFGLGAATMIDSLKIKWPSGTVDVRTNIKADTVLTITETPSTAVQEGAHETAPRAFELAQNYPNPFSAKGRGHLGNPATAIRYSLPEARAVKLVVYDTLGQVVATLVDERKSAGTNVALFEASEQLTAGVYFYRLHDGDFEQTRKLLVVR